MASMNQYFNEDFPKNVSINVGARHSFKTYDKLIAWIDKEKKFYQDIGNPESISSYFERTMKIGINKKINQVRGEGFTGLELVDDLKNYIEGEYKSKGLIASKSKEGVFLLKQHKKNETLTKGGFSYFQNKIKGSLNNNIKERNGEFSAYLFDTGIEPNFELEKEQYNSFYNEIIEEKDEILNELLEVREKNKKLNEQIEKQSSDWESTFNAQKKAVEERFDIEYDRHKSKMTESEDFYEKKLAVKNAVTYWSKKAKGHRTNSYIFGIIAGILIISSFIAIINFGNYIISLDVSEPSGDGRKILTETGALQLWVYGFFIVSMTLIIWFIRLVVKMFLSNLHLLSDANERETMIKTYLALEREEKTLKPTDRDLILPSIFRVSTDGFIKGDSAPNSPINIVTKKVTE
ncbi:MAG: hypothetical protein JXR05_09065 [Flavobacteriaceae bacterium]